MHSPLVTVLGVEEGWGVDETLIRACGCLARVCREPRHKHNISTRSHEMMNKLLAKYIRKAAESRGPYQFSDYSTPKLFPAPSSQQTLPAANDGTNTMSELYSKREIVAFFKGRCKRIKNICKYRGLHLRKLI
jgi:hypothetical protein